MSSALIVGYDGSDCAHAAFDAAVELARSTGDRIVVAFGYEPPVGYGEEIEAHREVVRQHGEKVTAEAMARRPSSESTSSSRSSR